MSDIIERSLNLRVEGEDLASDMLVALGEQIVDLQERTETAFASMASYAEDASSTIADAANEFAPVWISQLEALEGAAAGSFSTIAETSASAAANMAEAWATAFDNIVAGATAAASEVDAAWGVDGGVAAADAGAFAAAWADAFDGIVTDAAAAAGKVDGSWGADDGVAKTDADEFSGAWSDAFDTVAKDAATAAAKVDSSWGTDDGVAKTDASTFVDVWSGAFDGVVTAAAAAAAKVDSSWGADDGIAKTDASAFATAWDGAFDGVESAAATAAAKVNGSWGADDGVAKTDASAFTAAWSGAFDTVVADAKAAAGEVDAQFGISDAAAAAAGGGKKGAKGAATVDETASAGSGLSLDGLASGGLMTLIGGSIGLAGTSSSIGAIQNIGEFAEQTGESIPKALQSLTAAAGVKVDESQLTKLELRLQANLLKVEQQKTPVDVEGKPLNLGLGRTGVDPSGVIGAVENGTTGPAAAMQLLGLNADTLSGMNAQQQLAVIADRLGEIKNVNERTAVASELLGGRGAASLLPLLNNFETANTEAAKALASPSNQALIAQIEKQTGASGKAGAINYEEQLYLAEVKLESAFVELTPVMTALVKEVSDLIGAIADPTSKKHLETIAEDAFAIAGAVGLKNLVKTGGKKLISSGADAVKGLVSGGGDAAAGAGDVAAGAGETAVGAGIGLASVAAMEAIGIAVGLAGDTEQKKINAKLYPEVSAMYASNSYAPGFHDAMEAYAQKNGLGNATLNGTSADDKKLQSWAEKWLEGQTGGGAIAGTKINNASLSTTSAIEAAALMFGLDPKAMMADSYAESGLNPTIKNKQTGAAGLFQFMDTAKVPTWQTDYKALFGKAPTGTPDQYSAMIQAEVAGYAMKKDGIAGMTGNQALINMIGDLPGATANGGAGFEHPGALHGAATGDLSRANTFLSGYESALAKASAATKAKAPEIPKAMAVALNTLLEDAKTKLPQWTSAHEKAIEATLKILEAKKPEMTKTGADLIAGLIKGLQNQEGPLSAAAKKLAATLDSELKTALKIKSPSEMTAEIGEYLIDGLGAGITRSIPRAAGIAAHAGTSVARQLGTAPGGIAGGGFTGGPITIELYLDRALIGSVASDHLNSQMKLVMKTN